MFLVLLLAVFLVWRIDNTRAERFRSAVIDKVVPNMDWAMTPITKISQMAEDFQSYERIYQQNQELRRQLQQMKAWREAALQLEQENARLLDLNNVKLNPRRTYLSGELITDSGSPFRQSAIINIGKRDGVKEGWAAMDGLGLVGHIAGLGENTSRVIFVTDTASNIPVVIKPSDQKAILIGDNSLLPQLQFIESINQIKPGDRVFTSGDGGVFPSGLLVGQVALGADGILRTKLSADYRRLKFLRIIRHTPATPIAEPDRLIGPVLPAPKSSIVIPAEENADGRG
ncbi:UNVERIFIED_CONTAM: hypothetical protein GTU68_046059 [Idotea baltica]|nr:hypothetical protein [Idotea baltica]